MRVWRFQQISDEENKTIDGTDQSFNALQEENNDNSQTESETKKEQMSSQCLESEQEEMQQMEEAQNQQQESENNGDISNDSNKEGSSSNNNNDDNLNVNEEEQNINGLSKQENSSNGNFNSNQVNNLSNNSKEKSDTGNKQEQESSEQQNSQNNSLDSLGQQNQNTQSQNNQNQSEQEPFQLSLDADEFSQEFKQQLSEYMSSFSGLQGMSKQENQQSMIQQGSQQSGSQQSISQQESQETRTQQSALEQDMNQSNGQQDRPQQNTNQPGIQQGSSQQSTWSNQSGEEQENLSHGNETRKENSEETLEDDINQSIGKKVKPKRSNINQNQSSNTESSELKETDLGEQNARHNKPSNSTDGTPDVEPGKDEQSEESESSKNITEQERQDIRDIFNNCSNLSLEERRRLLNKVKKRIKSGKKYRAKLTPGNKKYIKSLEEERINENNSNNITDALGELPSFEERQRGDGYAIDTTKLEKVPNSVIKTLIDKFLNQRFCKKETNLNVRSNSLEETNGFHKWKVKDVIVHLKTHQVTKVLTDKVGYTYANGKNENVPLSFYFDMSGSMESFTSLLATLATELLKKDVKVLIGYNERVNVQVEKIDKDISIDEIVNFLTQAGNGVSSITKKDKVTYIPINRNIDNYLVEKKAERCVVFSDFDPISEVVNLSSKADVYWFCFEDSFDRYDLKYFQGFIYKVKNIKDIAQGLIKVNSKRFESLCFTDNPAALRGKVRKRQ